MPQPSLPPLDPSSLAHLPRRALDDHALVEQPSYPRDQLRAGVVHLGLGAFQRAHQALVFDRLARQGDMRWGVVGIAMRNPQLAEALKAQDGLYTVRIACADSVRWQVPGVLLDCKLASRERAAVVAAIAAPETRWLTLSVTEKGYGPELAELIVDGLAARQAAGLPGLTVASCDNLVDNGGHLKRLCLAQAAATADSLAAWIETRCAFPNSMVDRIVPAATPAQRSAAAAALGVDDQCALGTEEFWEWVIEDRFADPHDAAVLASVGVQVVEDVKPFEEAKLRMLNGSHTALAVLGAVQGWETVADGMAIAGVERFVHAFMTQVAMPGLRRPQLEAYRDALLERFRNPHLRHRALQIASDSSLKIPLRWGPALRAALDAGRPLEPLAFACAAWIRHLRGSDETGKTYDLPDPQAALLQQLVREHAGDPQAMVQALLSLPGIWEPGLCEDPRWAPRVTHWLLRIDALGVAPALDELLGA